MATWIKATGDEMRNDFVYMSQLLWEQEEMAQEAPVLTYKRKPLEHYSAFLYGDAWTLYFAPSTRKPKTQKTWVDVLARVGLTLVRWDNTPDGSIEVVARRLGQ
jgi:hypothetical protein